MSVQLIGFKVKIKVTGLLNVSSWNSEFIFYEMFKKKFTQGHKYLLDSKKVEIVCLLFLHPE